MFYFYVIRIMPSHLSLIAVFFSFLSSGSSDIDAETLDSASFRAFIGRWYELRCWRSLRLK